MDFNLQNAKNGKERIKNTKMAKFEAPGINK